jgi:hypothetical protein
MALDLYLALVVPQRIANQLLCHKRLGEQTLGTFCFIGFDQIATQFIRSAADSEDVLNLSNFTRRNAFASSSAEPTECCRIVSQVFSCNMNSFTRASRINVASID